MEVEITVTVGGLSHLLLDAVAHGTPMFYPFSMTMISIAPERVVQGGLAAYLTDPIFLLEPLLFGIAIVHWAYHRKKRRDVGGDDGPRAH